jgi:hypothetical protein
MRKKRRRQAVCSKIAGDAPQSRQCARAIKAQSDALAIYAAIVCVALVFAGEKVFLRTQRAERRP